MPDIRITPGSSIMSFTSSLNYIETLKQDASGSLNLYGSGSTGRTEIFSIDGNNGRLFTVSDDLSDSLFSVNTIAGLPVIEAFANNTVVMGQYGTNALVVSGSKVGIGTTSPSEKLDVNGYVKATGFKTPSGTATQFLMADGSTNSNTYVKTDGTGATGTWGINITGNAGSVGGYPASSLWRNDGGVWNPRANITLNQTANNQEWSFDITRNGFTGGYWQVWDSSLGTMFKVDATSGKVSAPYNFVGTLEGSLIGNAATAATLQTARTLTIGNTGKTFNGSANVAWTLAEIGAQAALTNPITGTATSGQVAFFNGTTTQTGDTNLFWDNTNKRLGIGTTALGARLDVRAQGALDTDIVFRVRNSANTQNFLVVNGAGDVYNRGAQGVDANTFFGEYVGRTSTGGYNSAFGTYSLYSNTTGAYNIAVGYSSLTLNTLGSFNTAVGTAAMYSNTSGNNNIAIGHNSLTANTSGNSNTAVGYNALISNTTGINNTALGHSAGGYTSGSNSNQTSNNSVYLGYNTRPSASGNTNEIVIGADAIGNGSNTVTLGNDSITKTVLKGKVGIGMTSPTQELDVNGWATFLGSSGNRLKIWDGTDNVPTISADNLLALQSPTIQFYATDVKDSNNNSIYLKLKTITGNTTIDNSYHNKIVRITASCTITIPAGLRTDFNCTFEVIGAYTAQFVDGSGATTSAPFGRYLKTDLTAMFYCTGTASNYRLNGSLATS